WCGTDVSSSCTRCGRWPWQRKVSCCNPCPLALARCRSPACTYPSRRKPTWAETCTRPPAPTTTAPGSSSATYAATAWARSTTPPCCSAPSAQPLTGRPRCPASPSTWTAPRWDTGHWRSQAEQDTTEDFATAVLLDIPDHEPVVHLVSCGHPPPRLLRGKHLTPLAPEASHLPIGFGGPFGITAYDVQTFSFQAGDLLLLYTDGVTEARNTDGHFYPLAERAPKWTKDDPDELLHHLQDDLPAHVHGRLDDDAAVVAIRRLAV
ncbi:PP2C family protein-serine/threonine phosphatase, partial [Streptomyces sp. NPDC102395]|uniref:PP2C family protein-serine/threonine phosphatase n=1 Tax=Streptomyces sp. NPDC102395 TaxID=3366168 RepID=UPI003815B02D